MKEFLVAPLSDSSISFLLFTRKDNLAFLKAGLKKWIDLISTFQNKVEIVVLVFGSGVIESQNSELKDIIEKSSSKIPVEAFKLLETSLEYEGDALKFAIEQTNHDILVVAPCQAKYCQATILKIMLGNISNAHLAGAVRELDNYPFALKAFSLCKGVLGRFFLCLPIENISGPNSILSRFQNWVFWFVFGVRYVDPFFPVRVYRGNFLRDCKLDSKGNFIHVEILAKANFLGLIFYPEQSWPESSKVSIPDRGDNCFFSDFLNLLSNPKFIKSGTADEKLTANNNDLPGSDGAAGKFIVE